jgi:hypothetical protein
MFGKGDGSRANNRQHSPDAESPCRTGGASFDWYYAYNPPRATGRAVVREESCTAMFDGNRPILLGRRTTQSTEVRGSTEL